MELQATRERFTICPHDQNVKWPVALYELHLPFICNHCCLYICRTGWFLYIYIYIHSILEMVLQWIFNGGGGLTIRDEQMQFNLVSCITVKYTFHWWAISAFASLVNQFLEIEKGLLAQHPDRENVKTNISKHTSKSTYVCIWFVSYRASRHDIKEPNS